MGLPDARPVAAYDNMDVANVAAAPGFLAHYCARDRVRKVRAAQGTVLDNVKAEQSDGKCNRKIPPKRKERQGECGMLNVKYC